MTPELWQEITEYTDALERDDQETIERLEPTRVVEMDWLLALVAEVRRLKSQ